MGSLDVGATGGVGATWLTLERLVEVEVLETLE
jgi:hypothetical protein